MENFDRRLSATSLNDEAKSDAQSMENKYDDANANEPSISAAVAVVESSPKQNADIMANNDMQQQQFSIIDGKKENLIYENQSEIEENFEIQQQEQEDESQRDIQSNYNYEPGEQQQQHQYEEQNQQSIFENEANPNNGSELHATSIEQYSYEPSAMMQNYTEQQQQDEYVYSHQQQQQQQNDSELGNYNHQEEQLDSNYQQQQEQYDNYENSTDYANESGGVYYDHDTLKQTYQQRHDSNYSHY